MQSLHEDPYLDKKHTIGDFIVLSQLDYLPWNKTD
jgi:hypothetical protein